MITGEVVGKGIREEVKEASLGLVDLAEAEEVTAAAVAIVEEAVAIAEEAVAIVEEAAAIVEAVAATVVMMTDKVNLGGVAAEIDSAAVSDEIMMATAEEDIPEVAEGI